MLTIKKLIIATACTAPLLFGSTISASAAPAALAMQANTTIQGDKLVVQAQTRREIRRAQRRAERRAIRRAERRDNRRGIVRDRRYGPSYRGYRGYRDRRPGYKRHNGFWYAPGAFIAGAIINNAVRSNSRSGLSNRHYAWCENRYRSYRASSNTFQPYGGVPRQRCNSPYDGR